MTTYIDPSTELPQNLGEIYSDRNIRIVGQARINPSYANRIDTIGLKVFCTPMAGGAEGVSAITDGFYDLSGVGSSLWVKITRSGTVTVTPEIYAAGLQPKSRKDYVQVFYQVATNQIVSVSSFLIYPGPLYTRLGYGVGQRIYDAIVGNSGDDHVTHTDLQTAINDCPTNGHILVRKMCNLTPTITINKTLKLQFQGYGTGIQATSAGNPATGFNITAAGVQLVGFGQILNFNSYGVNLNSQINSRIEMVFSGNANNINLTGLDGTQYNLEGSYGLTQNSHIETSTVAGTLVRWNLPNKRWEPVNDLISTGSDVGVGGALTTGTNTPAAMLTANGYGRFVSPTAILEPTGTFDCSTKHIWRRTGGTQTITLNNLSEGQTINLVMESIGALYTITWAGQTFRWKSGVVPTPTLSANRFDVYTFIKINNITYGAVVLDMKS